MLASLTSAQVADWVAFGCLEQIGDDVPPDLAEVAKKKQETERATAAAKRSQIESGLRKLKEKRG